MKVVQIIDKISDKILAIFCLILLLIGSYVMYDTVLIYDKSTGDNLKTFKPIIVEAKDGTVDWDMSALSKDVVAWITVDGTNIDYPIMQGKDNGEYLNKDPFGDYSLSGSIFLDSRNSSDFSDKYSLVYGHHMEYNKMFGVLDNFLKKDYFNEHKTGTLIVDKTSYKIKFFAIVESDASVREIFDPDAKLDTLEYIRKNAKIFYEPEGERIIALSTCKFPTTTERTILFGTITK